MPAGPARCRRRWRGRPPWGQTAPAVAAAAAVPAVAAAPRCCCPCGARRRPRCPGTCAPPVRAAGAASGWLPSSPLCHCLLSTALLPPCWDRRTPHRHPARHPPPATRPAPRRPTLAMVPLSSLMSRQLRVRPSGVWASWFPLISAISVLRRGEAAGGGLAHAPLPHTSRPALPQLPQQQPQSALVLLQYLLHAVKLRKVGEPAGGGLRPRVLLGGHDGGQGDERGLRKQ